MLRIIASSLKWKFVSLMIAVIVLTVSIIGVFSYLDTSRTFQRDVEHFSEQILKQANFNLNQYYQSYEQGFLLMGSSAEVKEWMGLSPEDTTKKAFAYYDIKDNYILPLMSKHPEIRSISLLSEQGNEFHVENGYFRLVKDYSLRSEPWLEQVRAADKLFVTTGRSDNYMPTNTAADSRLIMSMAKQFGKSGNGLIKMDISLEPVQNILREIDLGETGVSMVSDAANRIMVHPSDEQIAGMLPEEIREQLAEHANGWFLQESTGDMVIYETMTSTGWKTIAIIPYSEMNKSILRVRDVTIATTLVALALSVLLVISLTSSVTRRLTKLRRIIRRTQSGQIYVRAPVDGHDEVTDLSIAYNEMLDRLDQSIHALADSRLKQQQAAMTAMQSQINSHFLYNTLESINSMANLVNHREIEMTAINLSKMLRYAVNYEKSLVPLEEEINHTLRYLAICKLRFNDEIAYELAIDEPCRNLLCLKAVIQPVVENSLRHGIERTGRPMHIVVRASMDGAHMLIKVSDDGTGYSDEALWQFREKLALADDSEAYHELSRIGLLNVHYRIRMYDRDSRSGVQVYNDAAGAVTELRVLIRTKSREANSS